jgi:putative membrane protein
MRAAVGASAGVLVLATIAATAAAAPIQSVIGGPVTHQMAQMSRPSQAWVFVVAVAMAALYVGAIVKMKRQPKWWQMASFFGSLVITVAVVAGPLDRLAWERMFVAYIAEQILLYMLAAPLLLLGIPDWMLRPAMAGPRMRRVAGFVSNPVIAYAGFTAVFAGIHYPTICNQICHARPLFGPIRAALVAAGVLLWMPLLNPMREFTRSRPVQMLYLFLLLAPMTAVSAPIVYSGSVIYSWLNGPPVLGIAPLLDQRMGGILMWVGQGAILMIAASLVFMRWSMEEPE